MASDLTFGVEWLDPQGARGEELRATWARLEMRLDGEPITRLFDQRGATVRDAVYAPLYPLAEWFVSNWWNLRYEGRDESAIRDERYLLRHSLAKSREGYGYPSLLIESELDRVRLSWYRELLPAQRVELLSTGKELMSPGRFEEQVGAFIDRVLGRLESLGVFSTFLQKEWQAIQEADGEARDFCAAAGALGLAPYSLDDESESAIVAAGNMLPDVIRDEFFSAVEQGFLVPASTQVTSALDAARGTGALLGSLLDLQREAGPNLRRIIASDDKPWRNGYQAAILVRSELGLNGHLLRSFEELGDHFRLDSEELKRSIVPSQLPDSFDAVVSPNGFGSPGFALRERRSERADRYHFCRALLEFLVATDLRPALISAGASYAQKANRAFAAELLAPATSIQQRIKRSFVSFEDIEELADEFGVTPLVIEHQIYNHRLADIPSAVP